MRILVTGAAGFIGSHLANSYAENGHEVFGLDNYESGAAFRLNTGVHMFAADIRNRSHVMQVIKSVRPDLISHHAARIDPRTSLEFPVDDASTNYIGTINVVDGAIEADCPKLIFASSCAVYGDIGSSSIMIEGQFELPNCPYGISKLASEKYIYLARRRRLLRAVVLRYPNVYGPGQPGWRSTGVIAIFARAMIRGQPLKVFGDGTATYQYCHVNDIVRVNQAASAHLADPGDGFLIVNIAGESMSVNGLIELLTPHFPQYVPQIEYMPVRDGEQQSITMMGRSAKEALGWEPEISLREGILDVANAAKSSCEEAASSN